MGYTSFETDSIVTGLFKNGKAVDHLDDEGEIAVAVTPFYAESGGQVADVGTIWFAEGKAEVLDVQKAPHKQPLHSVRIPYGELKIGDHVHLTIDVPRRQRTMANHSSAHLVQSALKAVLGTHVQQAGSFVAPDYMRFDFTHYEKVSDDQLKTIEALVNRFIFEKHPVRFDLMKLDDAKASGATALFSEKYETDVRVVTMGSVSKELCGGTHVNNTQEIGLFKIVSEESIGSGIRRLTTRTQGDAYADFVGYKEQLERIADLFKANSINAIENRVEHSLKEVSELRADLAALKQQLALVEARALSTQVRKGLLCDVLIARVDRKSVV